MSKFKESSFHQENKPKPKVTTAPKLPQIKKTHKSNAFFQEFLETGKANWKMAPPEVRTRYRGIFLVLCLIPMIIFPLIEIYKRLEGKLVKKVRQGELLEGQEVRPYSEDEKWQNERNSLMYKLFGKDWFLEGFTLKTMKDESDLTK